MRVQLIPAVYAFYRGQPVDGFMARRRCQVSVRRQTIKSWRQAGRSERGRSRARAGNTALAAGDHGTASALFQRDATGRRPPRSADLRAAIATGDPRRRAT
jgi:thioredoxin-like negative regulator of GroEL